MLQANKTLCGSKKRKNATQEEATSGLSLRNEDVKHYLCTELRWSEPPVLLPPDKQKLSQ